MKISYKSALSRLAFACCGAILLTGCGGGGSGSDNTLDDPIARLTGVFGVQGSEFGDEGTFALQFDEDTVAMQLASGYLRGIASARADLEDDGDFTIVLEGEVNDDFNPDIRVTSASQSSGAKAASAAISKVKSGSSAKSSVKKNALSGLAVGAKQLGDTYRLTIRGTVSQDGEYVVFGDIEGESGNEEFEGGFEGSEINPNSDLIDTYEGLFYVGVEDTFGDVTVEIDENGIADFDAETDEESESDGSINAEGILDLNTGYFIAVGEANDDDERYTAQLWGEFEDQGSEAFGQGEIYLDGGFAGEFAVGTNGIILP